MAIREHPRTGTILLCDFDSGFRVPEMVKRRPCVVLSPKIAARKGLCTVVALSTTPPVPAMPYHCRIDIAVDLPKPWSSREVWVKGDMINAVAFSRLDFIRMGKAEDGRRLYHFDPVDPETLRRIRACVLASLGLASLTRHL